MTDRRAHAPSHKWAKAGCTSQPERYPQDAHGERFFMRCRDCNIEWTEYTAGAR